MRFFLSLLFFSSLAKGSCLVVALGLSTKRSPKIERGISMKVKEATFIAYLNGGRTKEEVKQFDLYSDPLQKVNEFRTYGFVVFKDGRFQITPKGFNRAREVMRRVLRTSFSALKLLEEFRGYSAKEHFSSGGGN